LVHQGAAGGMDIEQGGAQQQHMLETPFAYARLLLRPYSAVIPQRRDNS
jgi:hypothetical protein